MTPAIRWMMVFGASATLVLASTTVTAQEVRTFDDQVEGEDMDVALPGGPAPEQEQPEPQVIEQEAAPDQEGDEEAGPTPSYRVNIHEGSPGAGTPGATGAGLADPSRFLEKDDSELYQGIIPGDRDDIPHIQALREAADGDPTVITWVGFKPEEDRTRVFFQSPDPVRYEVDDSFDDGKLVVTFEQALIPERNFTRFIDTSHFGRVVERIEVEELDGNDVKVTLELNQELLPDTEVDGEYLYLDFPHDAGDATADAQ